MLRPAAFLLALLLALAAAPAQAQDAALASPASAPLPALLRPDADPRAPMRIRDPDPDVHRNVLIGAGSGCVVLGALAFIVNGDAYDGRVANGLVGCGLGGFAGGMIAFTMSTRARPRPWRY